jgi:TRAP-type uncharacterized transport system substrate-binding protein
MHSLARAALAAIAVFAAATSPSPAQSPSRISITTGGTSG